MKLIKPRFDTSAVASGTNEPDAPGVERRAPSSQPSSPEPSSRPTSPSPNRLPSALRPSSLGRGRETARPAWQGGNHNDGPPRSVYGPGADSSSNRSVYGPGSDAKRPRTSYLGIGISLQAPSVRTRPAPIAINNGLPHILMPLRLPRSSAPAADLRVLYDSGSAVNIGNKRHHLSLRATRPDLVAEYIEFDDLVHGFDPISLLGAISPPPGAPQPNWDQLTAIIRYHTGLYTADGAPFQFSVCLGDNVSTNTILGLADINSYGMDLMVSRQRVVCDALNAEFVVVPQEPLCGERPSSVAVTQLAAESPARTITATSPPQTDGAAVNTDTSDAKRSPPPRVAEPEPATKRTRFSDARPVPGAIPGPPPGHPTQPLPPPASPSPGGATSPSALDASESISQSSTPIAHPPPPAPSSPAPVPTEASASPLPSLAASRQAYQICCGEVSPLHESRFTTELSAALPSAPTADTATTDQVMATTPPTLPPPPPVPTPPVAQEPLPAPNTSPPSYVTECHGPDYYTRSVSSTPEASS